MDLNSLQDWGPFLAALATLVGTLLMGWRARRKIDNQTAETLNRIALALVTPLEERIEALEAEVETLETQAAGQQNEIRQLRRENEELIFGLGLLTRQIEALGHTPAYRPRSTVPTTPAPPTLEPGPSNSWGVVIGASALRVARRVRDWVINATAFLVALLLVVSSRRGW